MILSLLAWGGSSCAGRWAAACAKLSVVLSEADGACVESCERFGVEFTQGVSAALRHAAADASSVRHCFLRVPIGGMLAVLYQTPLPDTSTADCAGCSEAVCRRERQQAKTSKAQLVLLLGFQGRAVRLLVAWRCATVVTLCGAG
jgi:hypothetical protein